MNKVVIGLLILLSSFRRLVVVDLGELMVQIVQKQRVDDLVNIFNRRVVHAAGAAGFGV